MTVDSPAPAATGRARWLGVALWSSVGILTAIMITFVVVRVVTDVPNVVDGRPIADGEFEARYAAHPVVAYLHIVPGVIFLVGGLHQLSPRLRRRDLDRHRRVGRVLVVAAVVSAVFAVWFGTRYPYGGIAEATATVVFGTYLLVAIVMAVLAIRRRDVVRHRRWMVRAFSIALAVASIRLVLGFSEAVGAFEFDDAFGPAFWIAFSAHALAAELWLARFPRPPVAAR